MKKVKSALISVFYKDGLEDLVRQLHRQSAVIYTTGGTQSFIESLGIPTISVESVTTYPSILGGRVKTLHPKVFGGILFRRDNEGDVAQVAQYELPEIDLVVVDLYPFEQTVASGADDAAIIEKIDVGGPSMIRAAAKNHAHAVVVANKADYGVLTDILKAQDGATTLEQRRDFARKAFAVTAHYDAAISAYFNGSYHLRYGENPHQAAIFKGNIDDVFEKLHGKDVSYNNLLDINAAMELIAEFDASKPTFAILKHNNACGLASRPTLKEAYVAALAGDPISAFGGVLICNAELDKDTARAVHELFCEVIIAPSYDGEALEILKGKKNRIILVSKFDVSSVKQSERTMLGGVLCQERDTMVGGRDGEFKLVTNRGVSEAQMEDLIFANKIVKHSKSNAIVLAKDSMLIASGVGQTSRVDALKQAIEKAHSFEQDLSGSVMASDAFFPFGDCVEIAHLAGIEAVIEPGGSVRDNESVDYCNAHNMAMIMTGIRHFKH